jgi:hypothetical protein
MAKRSKLFTLAHDIEELENLLMLDKLFGTLSRYDYEARRFSCAREVLDTFDPIIQQWVVQGKCHRSLRGVLEACYCKVGKQISMEYFAIKYIEDEIDKLIGCMDLENLEISDKLRIRLLDCLCKTCGYNNQPNVNISLRHLYMAANERNRETFFQCSIPPGLLGSSLKFDLITDLLKVGDNPAFLFRAMSTTSRRSDEHLKMFSKLILKAEVFDIEIAEIMLWFGMPKDALWHWYDVCNKAYRQDTTKRVLSRNPINIRERERDQWYACYAFIGLGAVAPVVDAILMHLPAFTLQPYRDPTPPKLPEVEEEESD